MDTAAGEHQNEGLPMTRPTPRQGDYMQKAKPAALALTERARADMWRAVALGSMALALVMTWLIVSAARTTEKVFILDGVGNLTYGPLEEMALSKGFFNSLAIQSANVALQRSPAGFDLYDLVKTYFTPRAGQKLDEDLKAYREDIKKRSLQEKPIIEFISEPIAAAGSTKIIEVKGRQVLAGAYSGRVFYDEQSFTLTLTFDRNPDLGKAAAYPYVVSDFNLTFGNR